MPWALWSVLMELLSVLQDQRLRKVFSCAAEDACIYPLAVSDLQGCACLPRETGTAPSPSVCLQMATSSSTYGHSPGGSAGTCPAPARPRARHLGPSCAVLAPVKKHEACPCPGSTLLPRCLLPRCLHPPACIPLPASPCLHPPALLCSLETRGRGRERSRSPSQASCWAWGRGTASAQAEGASSLGRGDTYHRPRVVPPLCQRGGGSPAGSAGLSLLSSF